MARIFTAGGESRGSLSSGDFDLEGIVGGIAYTPTTLARSGDAGYRAVTQMRSPTVGGHGTTVYARTWVYIDPLATLLNNMDLGNCIIFRTGTTNVKRVSVTTDSNQRVFVQETDVTFPQVEIPRGQWVKIEAACRTSATAGQGYFEFRVNDVVIGTSSTLTLTTAFDHVRFYSVVDGWFDDVAVNNSVGTSQNSWCGDGKVVYLLPISDNAVGGSWQNGAGVASNLYQGVDNAPPAGVASASATAASQIRNAAKDTTGVYGANCAAYSSKLSALDTVVLCQPVAIIGNSTTTARSVGLTAVLTSGGAALTEVTGTTPSGTAAGTSGSGWISLRGTVAYGDIASANRGNNPIVRVRKNASVTDVVMVEQMALLVEYIQGVTTPRSLLPHHRSSRNYLLRR